MSSTKISSEERIVRVGVDIVEDEGIIVVGEKHDEVGERIEVEAIDKYEGAVDIVDDKGEIRAGEKHGTAGDKGDNKGEVEVEVYVDVEVGIDVSVAGVNDDNRRNPLPWLCPGFTPGFGANELKPAPFQLLASQYPQSSPHALGSA